MHETRAPRRNPNPRHPRAMARREEAVSEILGYILMFALSSVILVVSLQSFTSAKQGSEDIVSSVEMRSLADRVSARLLEASKVAQEFPNATYNITLRVPTTIGGETYRVSTTSTLVTVETLNGGTRATASTYKLDAIPDLRVGGAVYSSDGHITVRYEKDTLGRKWINVTGGS